MTLRRADELLVETAIARQEGVYDLLIGTPRLIPQLNSQITQMEGNGIIRPERMKCY
jgi:hypothetical protein